MFYYYKKNKYGNKKTVVDGITFDSRKEANRYAELKILERGGVITDLELQPRFELLSGFRRNGKTYRKIEYVADFSYNESGRTVVEDVKSVITRKNPVYVIKKKLLLNKFSDIDFREV